MFRNFVYRFGLLMLVVTGIIGLGIAGKVSYDLVFPATPVQASGDQETEHPSNANTDSSTTASQAAATTEALLQLTTADMAATAEALPTKKPASLERTAEVKEGYYCSADKSALQYFVDGDLKWNRTCSCQLSDPGAPDRCLGQPLPDPSNGKVWQGASGYNWNGILLAHALIQKGPDSHMVVRNAKHAVCGVHINPMGVDDTEEPCPPPPPVPPTPTTPEGAAVYWDLFPEHGCPGDSAAAMMFAWGIDSANLVWDGQKVPFTGPLMAFAPIKFTTDDPLKVSFVVKFKDGQTASFDKGLYLKSNCNPQPTPTPDGSTPTATATSITFPTTAVPPPTNTETTAPPATTVAPPPSVTPSGNTATPVTPPTVGTPNGTLTPTTVPPTATATSSATPLPTNTPGVTPNSSNTPTPVVLSPTPTTAPPSVTPTATATSGPGPSATPDRCYEPINFSAPLGMSQDLFGTTMQKVNSGLVTPLGGQNMRYRSTAFDDCQFEVGNMWKLNQDWNNTKLGTVTGPCIIVWHRGKGTVEINASDGNMMHINPPGTEIFGRPGEHIYINEALAQMRETLLKMRYQNNGAPICMMQNWNGVDEPGEIKYIELTARP